MTENQNPGCLDFNWESYTDSPAKFSEFVSLLFMTGETGWFSYQRSHIPKISGLICLIIFKKLFDFFIFEQYQGNTLPIFRRITRANRIKTGYMKNDVVFLFSNLGNQSCHKSRIDECQFLAYGRSNIPVNDIQIRIWLDFICNGNINTAMTAIPFSCRDNQIK